MRTVGGGRRSVLQGLALVVLRSRGDPPGGQLSLGPLGTLRFLVIHPHLAHSLQGCCALLLVSILNISPLPSSSRRPRISFPQRPRPAHEHFPGVQGGISLQLDSHKDSFLLPTGFQDQRGTDWQLCP